MGRVCIFGLAMKAVVDTPVRGWRDRVFSAAAFFFVSIFIIFVLTLIITDVFYVDKKALATVLASKFIRHALWMSIWTSCATTLIALLFAVPMGYYLSRFRFPGHILADAIVEVTETGSTIRAHGLKIIHELMQTNTQLIANRDAYKVPWKKAKIEQVLLLLRGALRAENMVGLKMNVPQEKLKEIIAILPSLNAPTIAGLYESNWASVETVVDARVVRDLIPALLLRGAEGIIEYPLNKVI